MERVNPELTDGAYYGPSRGHLQPRWARHVGMARGYGYGASMGAWVLDHVAAWAGEWGFITHSNSSYRTPAFTGDVTFIDAEVVDKRVERRRHHIAVVTVEMRNQDDAVLAKGAVEVELPRQITDAPAPGVPFGRRVRDVAVETPDIVALWFVPDHGPDEATTWRTLDERTNQIARAMQAAGVGEKLLVAIVLVNRPEHIFSAIAAWKLAVRADSDAVGPSGLGAEPPGRGHRSCARHR